MRDSPSTIGPNTPARGKSYGGEPTTERDGGTPGLVDAYQKLDKMRRDGKQLLPERINTLLKPFFQDQVPAEKRPVSHARNRSNPADAILGYRQDQRPRKPEHQRSRSEPGRRVATRKARAKQAAI